MEMKKALITGITGQDGSYLAEFLLKKGYEVHGILRRVSVSNTVRIDHLTAENKIKLHYGDLTDSSSVVRDEKGINKADGRTVIEVSRELYRPTDVVDLWGSPAKAKAVLGWNPQRTSYEELVLKMTEHDWKLAKEEAKAKGARCGI